MKRLCLVLMALLLCISTACAKGELSDMKISIQITSDSGSHTLTATLADNSSATAFYEFLKKGPVTIKMTDYGNFEKVGPLGTKLPRNDTQITTQAGDQRQCDSCLFCNGIGENAFEKTISDFCGIAYDRLNSSKRKPNCKTKLWI